MKKEENEHYSSEKNHWCIVNYISGTLYYYTGWFGKNNGDDIMKPAISIDFNDALKMHSKIAAEKVLNGLKSCSGVKNFIVEDHKWM